MAYIVQNIIGLMSPFNQLLLLQKLFTTAIIAGIKKIIPEYTNDDNGMYKIINYYGKNKDNLSKIYFFLSLFAKQLNYGNYDERTKKIIDDMKNKFFNLIEDVYKKNMPEYQISPIKPSKEKILKPNTSKKTKVLKSKISKKSKVLKSKVLKTKVLKSKISKTKLLKSKSSKIKRSEISKRSKKKKE
jgi:hypothetical protein